MAVDSEADVPLEIGHVLFMDVVGYSKLLLNEQRELQQQLSQIVRDTEPFRTAESAGKLIRLPVGDGMALVFFNSPEAPVRCALETSKALKENPRLQLRMGIHSGPVNQVTDVNDRTNIAGAGINIAQRVMDCADGGHILLSKRMAEDLAQSRQWQPHLHDLGDCEVKHGVNISVVNLYGADFGNSQVPEKIKKTREQRIAAEAASRPRPASRRRNVLIGAGVVAVVALASLFLFVYPSRSEKSIAVLPFENFSDDKENAFFADGIQDDILTSLARIQGLRVISRTSVMGYRGEKSLNLRTISKELDVNNVLEGSVRRESNRVVVTVQLIDARHDRHL
jgi:TolB-like protein